MTTDTSIINAKIKQLHPICTWGEPEYCIVLSRNEHVCVYRDDGPTRGCITYIIEVFDPGAPHDEPELRALTFGGEPYHEDLMWYIRETVCEMVLGDDADYRECWDFEDNLVIYDLKNGRVA